MIALPDECRVPDGGFGSILADPPWFERGGGRIKRGADRHYPLLQDDEIADTMRACPLWAPARSCHLWLWTTSNHLPAGLAVMDALDFRYVAALAWVKTKDTADPERRFQLIRHGLGRYFIGCVEYLLFGTRGPTALPVPANRQPTALMAPRRGHSVKPWEQYAVIEATSPGPRLEMFARGPARAGWTTWGLEAEG